MTRTTLLHVKVSQSSITMASRFGVNDVLQMLDDHDFSLSDSDSSDSEGEGVFGYLPQASSNTSKVQDALGEDEDLDLFEEGAMDWDRPCGPGKVLVEPPITR